MRQETHSDQDHVQLASYVATYVGLVAMLFGPSLCTAAETSELKKAIG